MTCGTCASPSGATESPHAEDDSLPAHHRRLGRAPLDVHPDRCAERWNHAPSRRLGVRVRDDPGFDHRPCVVGGPLLSRPTAASQGVRLVPLLCGGPHRQRRLRRRTGTSYEEANRLTHASVGCRSRLSSYAGVDGNGCVRPHYVAAAVRCVLGVGTRGRYSGALLLATETHRSDALVVPPYVGNAWRMHRSNDRLSRRQRAGGGSLPNLHHRLARADNCRDTCDCDLDGLLQTALCFAWTPRFQCSMLNAECATL